MLLQQGPGSPGPCCVLCPRGLPGVGAYHGERASVMTSPLPSVELHEGWLRVRFGERGHADFHLRWLRHNCDRDRHPVTLERIVCSSDLPDDLRADSARVSDDALVVRWTHDGRESRYLLAWLEEHAYARDRE